MHLPEVVLTTDVVGKCPPAEEFSRRNLAGNAIWQAMELMHGACVYV